jgi:NADPH-dependent 2,4-dienoyl-CoA reductase/sulfur reductase-like enzyme
MQHLSSVLRPNIESWDPLSQRRPKNPKPNSPNSLNTHTLQVKQRLEELQRTEGTSDVVVVGGGYAGIELASVAAEMLAGDGIFCLHMRCPSCALQ